MTWIVEPSAVGDPWPLTPLPEAAVPTRRTFESDQDALRYAKACSQDPRVAVRVVDPNGESWGL